MEGISDGSTLPPTLGQKRVRVNFNVGADDSVNNIKQATAGLIDKLEEGRKEAAAAGDQERLRLISLAQTAYEEAAMWAVKAVTG